MISDIVIENFLSYRSQAHMKIEQGKLNVVIGRNTSDYADSNGSGKTSLLKALLWGLYGRYQGMESVDSVINTKSKKDTSVRIFFTVQGKNYIVERYRKHSEHKNNIYLWCDSQRLAEDVKQVQQHIEDLIGMTYEIFTSVLVFTGEREDEFASGTDKDQKKVLDTLVPMSFDSVHDKAALEYGYAARNSERLQNEVERSKANVLDFEHKIQTHDKEAKEFVLTRSAQMKEAADVLVKSKEAEATHLIQEATYKTTEENWYAWQENAQKERTVLQDAMIAAQKTRDHYNHLQGESARLSERIRDENERHTNWALGWGRRLDSPQAKLAELQNAVSARCQTCGQTIVDEALAQAQQTTLTILSTLEEEKAKAETDYLNLIQNLEQTKTAKDAEFAELSTQDVVVAYGQAESAFNTHLPVFEENMAKFRTFRQEKEMYSRQLRNLSNGTHQAQRTLDAAKAATNIAEELAAQAKKDLEEIINQQVRLEIDLERANVKLRQWDSVRTMFSGKKGGLHHFVFEQVLPEMTAMAQMFLNFFSANTLKVAFRSHKKKGKKTIEGFFVEAKRGDVEGFGNLSRGEQRRINVAIALTLYHMASKHVFNPGILFLDEVADSLDNTGREGIIELLEHFCREYSTGAVLLTNERELIAHVHSGYECVMKDEESTLYKISES